MRLNLEASAYVDPAIYERERANIFSRTWQLLGPASQVERPGSYVAADIAGNGVIAVRGGDGELRAFRNICSHRGAQLVAPGGGECAAFRCPYHHWVFGHDGALRRTPFFGEDPEFAASDWPLQAIAVEEWRGLLFVAIEPATSLSENLGDTAAVLADTPIESYRLYRSERMVFDANWKIYTDNFIEGYHIPGIHPSFNAAIEFDRFETVALHNVVKMTAPPKAGLFYQGTWLTTWPNWTLSLFDGGMNTSRINPLGAGRTELLYHYYFADCSDATKAARDATVEGSIAVVTEDFSICEITQRNYASGGYRPGPLSPRHEQGVMWFQDKVREALGNDKQGVTP